jgi:hypothetical protein
MSGAVAAATAVAVQSSSTLLPVPSAVTIPVNTSTASFAATAGSVTSTQTVTITASYGGVSKAATVSVVDGSGGLSVTVTSNTPALSRYEIYEVTMTHTGTYTNPWEDVAISASFHSASGKTYTVGGFYYDTNTWKLRFAPAEAGTWTWELAFNAASKTFTTSGNFLVNQGTRSGYLRINPGNRRRFLTEGDNRPFYPIGMNDCVEDETGPKGVPDGQLDWYVDGIDFPVSTDQYFETYAAAGNDMFRHGPGNCAFLIHDRFNVNGRGKNFYSVSRSKLMDSLASTLHRTGMKYYLTFIANPRDMVPEYSLVNTSRRNALLSYHKYIIDRYGAYVDIWELMNEQYDVPASYYNTVISYIRERDPYKHPITTSSYDFPVRGVTGIELNSPHLFSGVSNLELDYQLVFGTYGIPVFKERFPNQPILIAEAGNRTPFSNYEPNRFRIFLWTSMFNEAGILFWNTSYARLAPGSMETSNMFIGPEERELAKIFTSFVSDFDVLAKPAEATISPASVRGYVLAGSRWVGGYFVNGANQSNLTSGVKVTIRVPTIGLEGQWIDPKTGAVLQRFTPGMGVQTLTIPTFVADIVLRIR